MADLHHRVQNLKELVLQTNKYIHLAKEEIIQKMELLALKEHMKMLQKTLDALERQMHEAIKLQL
jgi:predicted RNA-binding protein with EMAP domain